MNYSDNEKKAMTAIGLYYLTVDSVEMTGEKNFEYACRAIEKLVITRVIIDGFNLTLYLGRPGLLIGVNGKNIEKLGDFLKKELKKPELHILLVEDNLYNFLMPIDYSEGNYDFYDYEDEESEDVQED